MQYYAESAPRGGRRVKLSGQGKDVRRVVSISIRGAVYGLWLASCVPRTLSGIVLSLVDLAGHPRDGLLQTTDSYNLNLHAGLVAMSACQTALGAEMRGEGLVGLTRAFLSAGSPRFGASLWTVPDHSTAELMTRFYRFMLVSGVRPAAALRRAQISIWNEGRWARPYYWAAFTVQGEWR